MLYLIYKTSFDSPLIKKKIKYSTEANNSLKYNQRYWWKRSAGICKFAAIIYDINIVSDIYWIIQYINTTYTIDNNIKYNIK